MRDFIIIVAIAAIFTGVYLANPKWECKRKTEVRHGINVGYTVCREIK